MNPVLPNPEHATDAPTAITMYGADWCGDCLRAKAFFAEHAIDFDFVDLVEHELGTDVVLARNGGVQKIPVIIFPDNSHLTEPTNADLELKMSELAQAELADTESDEPESNVDFRVVENDADGRFELYRADELLSFANYSKRDDKVVVVPHVETIAQHRGQGNADRLMEGLLEELRASDRKIMPLCPFAAQNLRDSPQNHDLLA